MNAAPDPPDDQANDAEILPAEPVKAPARGPQIIMPDQRVQEFVSAVSTAAIAAPRFRPFVSILWATLFALLGSTIWAVITAATDYQLGIIAIVVGILAGIGARRGGRGRGAQVVGALAAAFACVIGQGLTICIILARHPEAFQIAQTDSVAGASLTVDPIQFARVVVGTTVRSMFAGMSLIFFAIAVWEGWRIPAAASDAPS